MLAWNRGSLLYQGNTSKGKGRMFSHLQKYRLYLPWRESLGKTSVTAPVRMSKQKHPTSTPPRTSRWSLGKEMPIDDASPSQRDFCAVSHGSIYQSVNPHIRVSCPLEAMTVFATGEQGLCIHKIA